MTDGPPPLYADDTPSSGAVLFVVRAAEALHRFGTPAHRLEAALREVASALNVDLSVFAVPTALIIGVGPPERQRMSLLRVQPAEVNLGSLAHVDGLMGDVAAGRLGPDEAQRRLTAILEGPGDWSEPVLVMAGVLACAAAAILLGGSVADAQVASGTGLLITAIWRWAERVPRFGGAFLTVAAFLATGLSAWVAGRVPDVHAGVVTLASLIMFVPGLSFTMAMVELATSNLVSGTARLAAVGVTLLRMALGVAIALHLWPDTALLSAPVQVPWWAVALAVSTAPLAFAAVLQVRPADLPAAWSASLLAYGGAWLGAASLGPEVGAGVGAFVLGMSANAYARWMHRPAAVLMVTGVLMLVPGSIGFRSVSSLLAGDVLRGVEQAFHMSMVAASLAAGLVFAASVIPPRKAL